MKKNKKLVQRALEALFSAMGKSAPDSIVVSDMCAAPVFAFHYGLMEVDGSKQRLVSKVFASVSVGLQQTFESLLEHVSQGKSLPLPELERNNFERLLEEFRAHYKAWCPAFLECKVMQVHRDMEAMVKHLLTDAEGEDEANVMKCFQLVLNVKQGLCLVIVSSPPENNEEKVKTIFNNLTTRVAQQLMRLLDSPDLDARQALRAYHTLLILKSTQEDPPRFPLAGMAEVARVWRGLKHMCGGHSRVSLEEETLCRILMGLSGRHLVELYGAWRKEQTPVSAGSVRCI